MSKAEHQLRRVQVTRDADDHAVNSPIALDLDPVSSSTLRIAAVSAFGDDAFDAGQKSEPILGELRVGGLLDQLQAGMPSR
jgi:hypothetical protein